MSGMSDSPDGDVLLDSEGSNEDFLTEDEDLIDPSLLADPLSLARQREFFEELAKRPEEIDLDKVQALIDASPNTLMYEENNEGNTSIEIAIQQNNSELLDLLLKNGAVSTETDSHDSWVSAALLCIENDNYELLEQLMSYGAQPYVAPAIPGRSGAQTFFHYALELNAFSTAALLCQNSSEAQEFLHKITTKTPEEPLFTVLKISIEKHKIKLLSLPTSLERFAHLLPADCLIPTSFGLVNYPKIFESSQPDPEVDARHAGYADVLIQFHTANQAPKNFDLFDQEPHENKISKLEALLTELGIEAFIGPVIAPSDLVFHILSVTATDIRSYLSPENQIFFDGFFRGFINQTIAHTNTPEQYAMISMALIKLKIKIKNLLDQGLTPDLIKEKISVNCAQLTHCHGDISAVLAELALKISDQPNQTLQEAIKLEIDGAVALYLEKFSLVVPATRAHVYIDGLYKIFGIPFTEKLADDFNSYIDTADLLSIASQICAKFDQQEVLSQLGQDSRYRVLIQGKSYCPLATTFQPLAAEQLSKIPPEIKKINDSDQATVLAYCFGLSLESIQKINNFLICADSEEIIEPLGPEALKARLETLEKEDPAGANNLKISQLVLTFDTLQSLALTCSYQHFPVTEVGELEAEKLGLFPKKESEVLKEISDLFSYLPVIFGLPSPLIYPHHLALTWQGLLSNIDGVVQFKKASNAYHPNLHTFTISNRECAESSLISENLGAGFISIAPLHPCKKIALTIHDRLMADLFIGSPLLLAAGNQLESLFRFHPTTYCFKPHLTPLSLNPLGALTTSDLIQQLFKPGNILPMIHQMPLGFEPIFLALLNDATGAPTYTLSGSMAQWIYGFNHSDHAALNPAIKRQIHDWIHDLLASLIPLDSAHSKALFIQLTTLLPEASSLSFNLYQDPGPLSIPALTIALSFLSEVLSKDEDLNNIQELDNYCYFLELLQVELKPLQEIYIDIPKENIPLEVRRLFDIYDVVMELEESFQTDFSEDHSASSGVDGGPLELTTDRDATDRDATDSEAADADSTDLDQASPAGLSFPNNSPLISHPPRASLVFVRILGTPTEAEDAADPEAPQSHSGTLPLPPRQRRRMNAAGIHGTGSDTGSDTGPDSP